MKRPLLLFFSLLCLCSVPLSLDGENGLTVGRVTFVHEICLVSVPNEDEREALLDQELVQWSTLKTLKDSEMEVTLEGGDILHLTEDSEMTLGGYRIREQKFTQIGLFFGTLRLLVRKLSTDGEELSVNTITTTAGIRGTAFEVSVREDGAVLVNVEEGAVETEMDGDTHRIEAGQAAVYPLSGPREDFSRRVDSGPWKKKAIQKIREDPKLFLAMLLERERTIIARLKEAQRRIGEYREEWDGFLRKTRFLESRGRYEEEKRLIRMHILRTKRGIFSLLAARRQLNAARSVLVLSARIERMLGEKRLPDYEKIQQEYRRLTAIIRKIDETEHLLLRVLIVLNQKYEELERNTQ
jgi:hypothetical protein